MSTLLLSQAIPEAPLNVGVGARIRSALSGEEYILARAGDQSVIWVNLSTGNFYYDPKDVEDLYSLTRVELSNTLCQRMDDWILVSTFDGVSSVPA